jgi:hypothetical protein
MQNTFMDMLEWTFVHFQEMALVIGVLALKISREIWTAVLFHGKFLCSV